MPDAPAQTAQPAPRLDEVAVETVPVVSASGLRTFALSAARYAFGPSPMTRTGWLNMVHDLPRLGAAFLFVLPPALAGGLLLGAGLAGGLVIAGLMMAPVVANRLFEGMGA